MYSGDNYGINTSREKHALYNDCRKKTKRRAQ